VASGGIWRKDEKVNNKNIQASEAKYFTKEYSVVFYFML
jgi:hypothetical protein